MSECRRICESLASLCRRSAPPRGAGAHRASSGCVPHCRRLADDEQSGRRLLRHARIESAGGAVASRASRRCEALHASERRVARRPGRFGPWWRVRLVPVLLTVVVMVFTASAFFSLATRRSDALLAAQLTADHSKCFKLFAPPDAGAADIAQHRAHARRAVRLERARSALVVRRRRPACWAHGDVSYGDGIVPHVMYRVHGQDVSLFVLAGTERKARRSRHAGPSFADLVEGRDDVRAGLAGRCWRPGERVPICHERSAVM